MKDKLKCDSTQYRRNVNEWLFKRGKLLRKWLIIFIYTYDSLVQSLGGGILPLLNELSNWLFFEKKAINDEEQRTIGQGHLETSLLVYFRKHLR